MIRVAKNREGARDPWQAMYDEQKRRNQWHQFHDLIGDVDTPPPFREEYRKSIREYASQLDQIIDGRRETATGVEGLVEWNDRDFARIQAGVYWVDRPLSVSIRLAQEDIWAYEAILRAIAKTNEEVDATSYDNAAIKRIETLEVSQPATCALLAASRDKSAWSPRGMGFDDEYDSEDWTDEEVGEGHDGSEHDPGIPAGPPSEQRIAEVLRTGRYVDMEGDPLAADSQPYPELNLLPVHLAVVMDQQRLPNFLAHLANSHMPLGVKHVRIDGAKQEVSSFLPDGGDNVKNGNTPDNASTSDEDGNRAVPVEIVGTMWIFKSPPP